MTSTRTKSILFLGFSLLLLGAAACTQQKPNVPTPTLIPLNQTPVLLASTPEATSAPQGTAPLQAITPEVPTAVETSAPVEPTLLPTPTSGIPTASQPTSPTEVPSSGGTTTTGGTGACGSQYTVQRGDWSYEIARKCGVSYQALVAANPNVSLNTVYPGQVLNMPGAGAPPAGGSTGGGSAGGRTYVVQPGDTLYRIGLRFGVSYTAIASANGIPAPYNVYAGQVLQIP
jgi:LysM repeat protein